MPHSDAENAADNRSPYVKKLIWLLIGVAVVLQFSRITQVRSSTGEVPFLSANDRSRWCTIAALSINGTYEIDDVLEIKDPKTKRRTWYTIDLVQHRDERDGQQHFYSSKPPLLPTLYAGAYIAIRNVTGLTLMNQTFATARLMLVLVSLIPLLALWVLLVRLCVLRSYLDEWGAIVLTTFIGFGTYLSTFVISLNNHLPAAIAVGLSLWCLERIAVRGERKWWLFILCGVATSFAASNELPALSWLAAAGAVLFIVDWRKSLLAYAPALLPVAMAFFGLNYVAHGTIKPAYAHRSAGVLLATVELGEQDPTDEPAQLIKELNVLNILVSDVAVVRKARRPGIWELWDEENQRRFAFEVKEDRIEVRRWGDWYDYPTSYWVGDRKQGVDRGEPSRTKYIFHCLLGHHGILSLTPFWLVSLVGVVVLVKRSETWNFFRDYQLLLAMAIVATSFVVISFYLARPLEDRNYGGVTSGFRWAFWLAPLWIWLASYGLQKFESPWSRRMVELLLLLSVFSASFAWSNPWVSPWLMQLSSYMGLGS